MAATHVATAETAPAAAVTLPAQLWPLSADSIKSDEIMAPSVPNTTANAAENFGAVLMPA